MPNLVADITTRITADPRDQVWDIVVIGTGAGGGVAGFNLARLGHSVLFLDRAPASYDFQESFPAPWKTYPGSFQFEVGERFESGASATPIRHELLVGNVIGGSTASFAMVMDRFRPIDFQPGTFANLPSSTCLPHEWPIQYEELQPYYEQAEALFRVRGTSDPLYPTRGSLIEPVTPSKVETQLIDTLERCGLHPYRIHYARENVADCNSCVGKVCPRDCRNDSARVCIRPALAHHGAHILPDCLVLKLEANRRTVTRAICSWKSKRIAIRGRVFILALNALLTPSLLLRSANTDFPNGLGNTSGLIGRNLMLHVSDLFEVTFDNIRGQLNSGMHHGISLNDFYVRDGVKLGNIHAHSLDVGAVIGSLPPSSDSGGTAWFSSILDDFPYLTNRVTPAIDSNDGVSWEYTFPNELRTRNQILIDALSASLQGVATVRLHGRAGTLNGAHMCGTCRFGRDARQSVLDHNNRVHELDNAYVVDASFFPSSGGINPTLNIAANALRVSELLADRRPLNQSTADI